MIACISLFQSQSVRAPFKLFLDELLHLRVPPNWTHLEYVGTTLLIPLEDVEDGFNVDVLLQVQHGAHYVVVIGLF